MQSRIIDGLPDRVTDTNTISDNFCEDCINGRLTRAPHSKPAMCMENPLLRVFSDLHGPVPVQSWKGHYYWVTFIDDHSCHPAIYYLMHKLDAFATFKNYKAWAENAMGQRIRILCNDKGGRFSGDEWNVFF